MENCHPPPVPADSTVLIVELHSKERKTEAFANLPDHIRYKRKILTCDGKPREVVVPVAEIRLSIVDDAGNPVPKELATSMLIEYMDRDGNVLETTRMVKDK